MTQRKFGKPGSRVEDGVYRCFIANSGVDHQVEAMPFGPCEIEISLNEIRAIIVHRLHQVDGFLFALADCLKPADLLLKGGVDENVKGIAPVCEVVSRSSAYDHAIASLGYLRQNFVRYGSHAIGIHHVEAGGVHASFKTA